MSDNTRAAFEAYYSDNGKWPNAVAKNADGGYMFSGAASSWTTWEDAWTASRLQAIEEAAKVCDEQAQRSTECSEKATRVLTKDLYRNTAFGAKFCASAIRNLTHSEDGKA